MSVCISAQAAGARTVCATSSCGLALMYEMLYIAASCRLPITLACVNRALSGPININNDHSDSMGARDAGLDTDLCRKQTRRPMTTFSWQARRRSVRLPVMCCKDGFITSHAVENIELLATAAVQTFVGQYEPDNYLLKKENPLAVGPYDISAYYMEHKVMQHKQ
jgi:pyruvate ferredoxin oxidoreductase alpha subunit